MFRIRPTFGESTMVDIKEKFDCFNITDCQKKENVENLPCQIVTKYIVVILGTRPFPFHPLLRCPGLWNVANGKLSRD